MAPTVDSERAEEPHFCVRDCPCVHKKKAGRWSLWVTHDVCKLSREPHSCTTTRPKGGEKNADYRIKTKVEKLVKLGIEKHLQPPAHGSP